MCETWKDVVGFEGLYRVSDFGRVMRVKTGKLLTPRVTTKNGVKTYGGVALYKYFGKKDYIRKDKKIALVVAEAFIGTRPNGMLIDHLDCNKRNDALDNLQYVTPTQNVNRAFLNGCFKRKYRKMEVSHL